MSKKLDPKEIEGRIATLQWHLHQMVQPVTEELCRVSGVSEELRSIARSIPQTHGLLFLVERKGSVRAALAEIEDKVRALAALADPELLDFYWVSKHLGELDDTRAGKDIYALPVGHSSAGIDLPDYEDAEPTQAAPVRG